MRERATRKTAINGMRMEKKESAVLKLPPCHPCYGCFLYNKHNGVLFCPYPSCIRKEIEALYCKMANGQEVSQPYTKERGDMRL